MDHKRTEEELIHLNETRDIRRNLQLGGMTYNELKLQVDTNHNLLYCDLPKCGSSVWQKQMMKEMAYQLESMKLFSQLQRNHFSQVVNSTTYWKTKQKSQVKLQLGTHSNRTRRGVHTATMDQNRFLYSFLPEEQLQRLKSDFKFIFVRHPFERLLSAYRDKAGFRRHFCFLK